MNTENTDTVTPLVDCPVCGKLFKNAQALRMHTIRKHGKGWDTSRNFGKPIRTKEEQLAHRRAYQKKLRARYYSEGRNSRGEQMPPGWKPNARGNYGMSLPKWSPQRLAKFRRTMRKKAMQRAGKMLFEAGGKKRIQIVYPEPKVPTVDEAIRNTWPEDEKEAQSVVIPYLKFCPNCGEAIERWKFV